MFLFLDIGHCDGSTKRGALPGKTLATVSEFVAGTDAGALLGCAAGVIERPDAEEAARSAATATGEMYFTAIEAASAQEALSEALSAANAAVRTGGERGRAAAVAAVVLQGSRWVVGHAGDVRAWQYRDARIRQLTRDHVVPRPLRRAELTRGCGLAETFEPEYDEGELREGDIYLLTSAGVHDALSGSTILGILESDRTAQQIADALVQQALVARASSYLGVCVARVEKLPPKTAANEPAPLPILDPPRPGAVVDAFVIEKLMVKSRRYRVYRAKDKESGETVALRFPLPGPAASAQAFLREEWAARQVESPFILKPVAVRPGRRTSLYSIIEYRNTENLAKRIRRKGGLPLSEALRLGGQLLAGIETLHAQGLLHRDIRANSLLYDKINGQLWMLGLGTPRTDARPEKTGKSRSSTLSYWAPELFGNASASERSDLYAAGVTLYRMLTAKYPYGRIRSPDDWKQPRAYVPLGDVRENLPEALDDVLRRACAPQPTDGYATVAQFTAALDSVAAQARPMGAATRRSRRAHWPAWLAAGLAVALAIYLYFVLRN